MKCLMGYRKLIVMLIIIAVAVVLRLLNYLESLDSSNLIATSAVAFFAANLIGKFSKEEK